jgi:uncharacterized Tic20 family protein
VIKLKEFLDKQSIEIVNFSQSHIVAVLLGLVFGKVGINVSEEGSGSIMRVNMS